MEIRRDPKKTTEIKIGYRNDGVGGGVMEGGLEESLVPPIPSCKQKLTFLSL